MRKREWLGVLVAVMVCGFIALGCGSSSDSTTSGSTTGGSDTTSTDTGSTGSTPDDVYNACIDAISGTPAESVGKTACEQARSAFQQCSDSANNLSNATAKSTAIDACQSAADATISTLKATS